MLLIQDILVSDEVVSQEFLCNLNACKGACCWEGDYGAPLEDAELPILDRILPLVKPFLNQEGISAIEKQGAYAYFDDAEAFGTPLVNGGPCAYMTRDEQGIAQCGIERAYKAGVIDFQKPISCHLYPIRVVPKSELQLEMLNYERWSICSAACTHGKKHKVPLYQFVKDALIRKYGTAFYESLEASAQYLQA